MFTLYPSATSYLLQSPASGFSSSFERSVNKIPPTPSKQHIPPGALHALCREEHLGVTNSPERESGWSTSVPATHPTASSGLCSLHLVSQPQEGKGRSLPLLLTAPPVCAGCPELLASPPAAPSPRRSCAHREKAHLFQTPKHLCRPDTSSFEKEATANDRNL